MGTSLKYKFRHESVSTDETVFDFCEDTNAILNGWDHNVILTVHREEDLNVIVYRANTIKIIDASGQKKVTFDSKRPIDAFWLKIGEKDLRKHRKAGKVDDRVPLNMMEKKMLFGVKSSKIKRKNSNKKIRKQMASSAGLIRESDYNQSYLVTLNALKKKENAHQYILRMDPIKNRPYLYGKINIGGADVECALNEIVVSMKKSKVPKINFLTIKGERCDNLSCVEGYIW